LVFKWTFIAFNVVMLLWIAAYMVELGELSSTTSDEYERAGVAIGGTIGTGMLVAIWLAGVVILGLPTLLTRPSK